MHQHYYCLQFRNILNVSNVPKDFPDMIQCNVYALITLSAAANHVFIKNSCSDDANAEVASAQYGNTAIVFLSRTVVLTMPMLK